MARLDPKLDRVLVKRESLKDKTSLIELPAAVESSTRPARGVIVALGPTVGYVDEKSGDILPGIEVGERVIFGRNAGVEVDLDGEKYWLVTDRDILCGVKE
jgi:chaperonin GroES